MDTKKLTGLALPVVKAAIAGAAGAAIAYLTGHSAEFGVAGLVAVALLREADHKLEAVIDARRAQKPPAAAA